MDTALKEKLLTEFAKDVSSHIIGNLLPLKLREHLRHYLEMSLVRESWNITYTLVPYLDRYVKVTVFSDFEIENRSSNEQKFEFVIKVEKSWFEVGKNNRITWVRVNEGPPQKKPKCVAEGGNWVHRRSVKLPPHDKDNPQRFRFRTESVQYFYECAFSPFISMWPVSKATVTVNDPMKMYDVMFDPTFKTFKTKKEPVPMRLQGGTQLRWEVNEPILPGQGFFVRWSKKSTPMAATIPIREPAA